MGDDASVGFQAMSGLYYLIANQERVLVIFSRLVGITQALTLQPKG